MIANRPAIDLKGRPTVTVFLDESGTSASEPHLLAGAIVSLDADALDERVDRQARSVLAADHLWASNPSKRARFQVRGFHHAEDDDTVRGLMATTMEEIQFRAHVCVSRKTIGLDVQDSLIVMFFMLCSNLMRRYRGCFMNFVFEENEMLNRYFARIVAEAAETLRLDGTKCYVGTKPLAGLSVVDYVLAFAGVAMPELLAEDGDRRIENFKLARYRSLGPHVAHLFDFDRAVHRSGRAARLI